MSRLINWLIDFSHNKLMSEIQPVFTRLKNTIRKERTYDVLFIQRESGNGKKKTWKKRHLKKKKHVWAPAYRRTIERRAAASTKP